MAAPSKKLSSSSPMSSRALPNPVLRNSETVNPVRRSIAGSSLPKPSIIPSSRSLNPKTPANSPLDHPPRNSTYCRDLDEKENGKDHNPKFGRAGIPLITSCTKNFMSPTISASSKIAMSPKKKILVERNESVRTSLSSSDLKSSSLYSVKFPEAIQRTSLDLKPDDCSSIEASSDSKDLRPALQASSSIPKASKTVTFIDNATKSSGFSANDMFEDADLVNLDYRFKISPASSPLSCQTLAPHGEDPSMAPYDPKTNYLSPRPQFLHYRPNPRIERYLHVEEDGKRLEGSLLFESFSDTEVTEETQSDSSQKPDEVSSDGIDRKETQEEEEEIKEGEEEEEKEEHEQEEDHKKSEPCLVANNTSDGNSIAIGKSRPSFRSIYKITALILLLCFACSFVFHTTPLVNRTVFDEYSFLMKTMKPKYPVLAENFQVWLNNVVAFAHGMIFIFQEENHQMDPVRYFNLSALQEDKSVDGYVEFYQTHERMHDFLSEPTSEIMVESELLEEDELLQNNVKLEEEAEENSEIMENPPEQEHEESHESLEPELRDEGELLQNIVELEKEAEKTCEIMEDPERSWEEVLSGEHGKSESEVFETNIISQERPEIVEEAEQSSLDSEDNDVSSAGSVSSEMDALSNANPPRSEAMRSKQVILLILIPPLMAAAIFAYSRRQGWMSSSELSGESCPSEQSSSHATGGKRGGGSKGKNQRRESLSSSLDSPSYGSFTAYERISTKQGDMEEEFMTPVRRSSRIKTKLHVVSDH